MPKVMLPLAAQPLWLPTENLAAGPWEPVCAPVRLAAAAASVSFASIPAQYVMFRLRCQYIDDSTQGRGNLVLNNDTGANYSWQRLYGESTSVVGQRSTAQTSISDGLLTEASGFFEGDYVIAKPIAGAAALVVLSSFNNRATASHILVGVAGIWSNTADLINRIDLVRSTGNFAAGSIFILEGSRF